MILAAALLFATPDLPPVTEVVDSRASFVSVQAVVKLPHLSAYEREEAQLMAETMTDQVEGYSRVEMRNLAGRAGDSVRVMLMPDELRIQMGVLPVDMKSAIGYIDQVLRNAEFPEDSIKKAIGEIPYRRKSLWSWALQPAKVDFRGVHRADIVDLYHKICRPENVWLAVGGSVKPGEADQYWTDKNADWKVGRPPTPSLDRTPAAEITSLPGREATVELRGKEIVGNDPSMPTQLLAIIALGSGKGSAMFQVLREAQGWSYRQEAVLWPTEAGFVPRLIMASGDKTPPAELAKSMKQQLIDAVNAWTDADLNRARGMAEGILTRGLEMSPLYFNPGWPIETNLHDQTFLHAYWRMKTGLDWDAKKLVGEMTLIGLAELKETALGILSVSIPHVIPAQG
ncbi:MAG TPA: insulinase family protein [Fimbriimonadaceae bacterium]|nr:insulinase family protein [Fimbriimonadaceae bacterium]